MKDTSPFTPGSPVPVDLFVGRNSHIQVINEYIRDTASGRQENIFLSGDRGIGKSSLATYLRLLAAKESNIVSFHVFLGGVNNLNELVRRIFEEVVRESNKKLWFDKIRGNFGDFIQKIDLFGISIAFKPPKDKMDSLTQHFPEAIKKILDDISNDTKGFLLILDDINGISKTPEFAHWYKSFVDYVATHYSSFPVCIILIGVPELRNTLSEHQPSLLRIFRVINIDRLDNSEVKQFFIKAFSTVNVEVEDEAIEIMIKFSSGFPILMQEIGDAVYRRSSEGKVNKKEAFEGVISAAKVIGEKYLDPKVYQAIRSKKYRSILRKMGRTGPAQKFSRQELSQNLNSEEKNVLNNFLRKMKQLGIIIDDVEEGKGHYQFINALYPVYIMMESALFEDKMTDT